MTTVSRFEHDLARVLDGLVEPPGPDEISAVLARTAVIRQRPSWTYPERWIPFAELTARITADERVPVRLLALLVLLILLAGGAFLLVGSSQPRPRPFGPATNGLVIFSAGGDIFTADPVTGAMRRVVGGVGWDIEPRWSRDGSHFLFIRDENGEGITGRKTLYVARADGTYLRAVMKEPQFIIGDPMFSPDGTSVLFVATGGLVSIASADGRGPLQVLDLPFSVQEAAFRPPDGSSISLLVAERSMYLVNSDGTDLRQLFPIDREYYIGQPTWSPDGSVLAYIRWLDTGSITARIALVSPESEEVRALPVGPGSAWEGEPSWSNDGTRLAVARGYAPDNSTVRAAIVPVPAGGLGVETDPSLDVLASCCLAGPFEWAPDDSAILFTPTDTTGPIQQTLIDPATGEGHLATWRTTSGPSWQRRP